ncbi:MAG TPA: hypothetical protein VHE55_14760 [Fimbriimonadaceae bacterium]|nr:hypothetical protein [Fimbriimonadaceae bacterium]
MRRPAVIVEDPVARAESERLATERGKVAGAATVLTILILVLALGAIGYFVWWAPVNQANAQNKAPQIVHDTRVIEKPVPTAPPTIINNPPPQPPVVIDHDHSNTTDGGDTTNDTAGSGGSGTTDSGSETQTGGTTGSTSNQ